MQKLSLLVYILIVSSLFLAASCASKKIPTTENHYEQKEPVSQWAISPDKYVFINHHVHIHGELIQGECPILCIDFPTYSFDEENQVLSGWIDFEINEELKIVYGSGKSLSGVAGMGAGTKLFGVYELPYRHIKFEIDNVWPDGTARIKYDNKSITLKAGEKWVNTTSEVYTERYADKLCTKEVTITDTIVNYGILHKSKIMKTGESPHF